MGKKHKKHKSDISHGDDRAMDKTPLKLVLKLGSEVMYDSDYAANSPASSIPESSSHRSRKRKKKRRYDDEIYCDPVLTPEMTDKLASNNDITVPDQPADSPKIAEVVETEEDREVQMILPCSTEPKSKPEKVVLSAKMRKALNSLLEHLLKQLERKDAHDIFAWPVNDMIAPGYSSVIAQPMDFSTMRNKIITDQYFDVTDFKTDFNLMINNCCLYNNPDTVYYDIAKKVSGAGLKIMSNERLKNMKRTLNFLHDLTKQELSDLFGFSVEEESIEAAITTTSDVDLSTNAESIIELQNVPENLEEERIHSPDKEHNLKAHPDAISFTDADNEDSVALDAVEAMKNAKNRLAMAFPKNRIGFLRMNSEGKTTLNILNPDAEEIAEREVDLGGLTGSISSGFDVMPEAKEDKRNKVTPLEYLSYGPFGSYAPTYDSRMSNLTQAESDLLLSAYGSETGLLFAKSIEDFVADSNKGLVKMVDDILDTVTHGAHSTAIQEIKQKRNKVSTKKAKSKADIKIDVNELKSLQNLGIDVTFLKEVEALQQRQHVTCKIKGDLVIFYCFSSRIEFLLLYSNTAYAETQKTISTKQSSLAVKTVNSQLYFE